MEDKQSTTRLPRIEPEYAWLLVFFPTLVYFLSTRFQGGELGQAVQSPPSLLLGGSIFSKSATAHLVLSNVTIVASTWKHDEELGRGFLVFSAANRIWRWERGGGPIPIGKTLFMDKSGCRSGHHLSCDSTDKDVGSGGLAIDFSGRENPFDGRITIAEWGEGRIIRLEESGARTPLVIQVPDVCIADDENLGAQRRIGKVTNLHYTAFGDLLVVENNIGECQASAVYSLSQATAIPPLQSSWDSRQAHQWNDVTHSQEVELLFSLPGKTSIGGIAMESSWTGFLLTLKRDDRVYLVNISLAEDDDNLEQETLLDLSKHAEQPGDLAIDAKGNVFIAVDNGVLIVSSWFDELGVLQIPTPTSLTIGEDGYLYVASSSELYRIKVKNGPLKLPTNMLRKSKGKKPEL